MQINIWGAQFDGKYHAPLIQKLRGYELCRLALVEASRSWRKGVRTKIVLEKDIAQDPEYKDYYVSPRLLAIFLSIHALDLQRFKGCIAMDVSADL